MSALPLSAVSPLVPLSVAQASCPKAARECLGCFQSLHGLKLAVGSSHAGEIKYNAKFFQVHDICFPGILFLLSSLKADSWKWNWCTEKEFPGGSCCGMAVAVLKLSCCWGQGTSGCYQADSGASVGGDAFSANGPCFSPLWHGGSLASTV